MLKWDVKTAWRNIVRHKGYSFINIFGLAVGMACCVLMMLWIQNESSFDCFHANGNSLCRVIAETRTENDTFMEAEQAHIPARPSRRRFPRSSIFPSTWGIEIRHPIRWKEFR